MKKENYRTISFTNTDVKILSKISAGKIAKTIFKKKKKTVGKLTLPDFKTYCKTIVKHHGIGKNTDI